MLVLQRKEKQSVEITIPPSATTRKLTVTVVEFRSLFKVRLGFKTDDDAIVIDRAEIAERKATECRKSSG